MEYHGGPQEGEYATTNGHVNGLNGDADYETGTSKLP